MSSPSSYVKDEQGTFIPASQRPDGTWRKPRRVKDGYVPQEEVPLYESKGKQFTKNKATYPVGMSAEYVAQHKAKREAEISKTNPIPGLVITPEVKKKKKKKKNKGVTEVTEDFVEISITAQPLVARVQEKKVDEKTKTKVDEKTKPKVEEKTKPKVDEKTKTKVEVPKTPVPEQTEDKATAVDPVKRLKNLRKKIREIESLAKKIKNGEIKNPDKEMLDKVSRKSEIQKEIKKLEASQKL
ncbi:partner of Y14 and mago [Trichogramma pretiosum]|uniref:partner of Y14 and mago n=1 Tax=Trichogramma pretiosum TaxID=7493 RepID=UPI0006C96A4E|nr:partner of Y14 and mago [Trichogramma pretiosum]